MYRLFQRIYTQQLSCQNDFKRHCTTGGRFSLCSYGMNWLLSNIILSCWPVELLNVSLRISNFSPQCHMVLKQESLGEREGCSFSSCHRPGGGGGAFQVVIVQPQNIMVFWNCVPQYHGNEGRDRESDGECV